MKYDEKYTLQDPENIKEFDDVMENKLFYTKKYFRPSYDGLLARFKKVFHITPVVLKVNSSPDIKHLRDYAIYLLANHTNDFNRISEEFNITLENIEGFKNNEEFLQNFKQEEDKFFKEMIVDCINNIYANISLGELANNATQNKQKTSTDYKDTLK